MSPPPAFLPLFPREPATSSTASSSSISLPSLLSILLPLLMLLLAIITLGVYKYVGWKRGKKLDEAVEKHAREVERRRKLAKIRYVYGMPGMYGSGYDGGERMSGPPVGWCTQKWLEVDARRSFISLSSLSASSSRPSSLVDIENNIITEPNDDETKGQGLDQKRYSQLYQQLQSYRANSHTTGGALSYRTLPSHTDEIPLSPDQYDHTADHPASNPFSQLSRCPPAKQASTIPSQPQPQSNAATTAMITHYPSPPSLQLPTFALGDDPRIEFEEAMPSRPLPLKSTTPIRRFEKRTSPLKRQFKTKSVGDGQGKEEFMRDNSLGLSGIEKQTSTSTFNIGTTPIEDDFHTSLIHGPGISDQSDHLEFTDADSSVTTR
ncbi:hypothetical protein C359_02722 [Cryptococcus neoformans Bt120]|nr:hypothetical protein C360_03818 [Cryptococcus neoformans var. grubii Bt15]OXG41321.1 hypothetical protein C359_02722 [Cryptococcus neoformans var. grubii Bt120]